MRPTHLLATAFTALLLAVGGCATQTATVDDVGAGELAPVTVGEPQSGDTPIGTVIVPKPGAPIVTEPGGITIGRVPPGDTPVYGAQDGWYLVLIDTCEGTAFGWIPDAATKFTPSGAESSQS